MAAAKRGGLGKGLDSLIPEKTKINEINSDNKEQDNKESVSVDIQKVEPNRNQPRKNFDEDSLIELSDSIRQFGILQPLIVQDKKDYFEIIAGERRWRAAKMANLKEVPVIIKEFSKQEIVEISLIENIQREDLNPIEEAIAFKRLLDEFHLKQDEVAERVSKSRTAVTNSMRLLKLSEKVQQMVIDDMLTTGHARALLGIDDSEKQYIVAQKIFDEKLSVRETEKLVKKILNDGQPQKVKDVEQEEEFKRLKVVYHDIEEKMKQALGTKVIINYKDKNKGKIEIEYYDSNQLEHLFEMFQTLQK